MCLQEGALTGSAQQQTETETETDRFTEWKEGQNDQEATGTPQEEKQIQKTWAQRSLWILKHQPRTTHGLDLGLPPVCTQWAV